MGDTVEFIISINGKGAYHDCVIVLLIMNLYDNKSYAIANGTVFDSLKNNFLNFKKFCVK